MRAHEAILPQMLTCTHELANITAESGQHDTLQLLLDGCHALAWYPGRVTDIAPQLPVASPHMYSCPRHFHRHLSASMRIKTESIRHGYLGLCAWGISH